MAIELNATTKKRKRYLGKVERLKRSLDIKDVTTGKRIMLGGTRQPYYGVVIGMSRSMLGCKRRPRGKV